MAENKNRKPADSAWDNLKQILLAVVLALIIKTSIVEAYKIPSQSMEDTLLVGDFLLANKFIYGARIPLVNWRFPALRDPQPGDVVIFIYPGDMTTKYIKRCVAVAGDTVLLKDKQLFVNGEPFAFEENAKYEDTNASGDLRIESSFDEYMEAYKEYVDRVYGRGSNKILTVREYFNFLESLRYDRMNRFYHSGIMTEIQKDHFGPVIVEKDTYFMMGDNRDNSADSRFWGAVHKDLVLGEAMAIHWSWNEDVNPSPDVSVRDPLSVPRLFLFNTVHFFQKVRWGRLFSAIP